MVTLVSIRKDSTGRFQRWSITTQHCHYWRAARRVVSKVSKVSKVTVCINEIDDWMSSNRLKLNSDKTQFIWLGTRQQLQKIGIDSIQLGSSNVKFQTSVGNLGVTLDSHLSMKAHVQRTCRTCYYQLRQLRTVRRSLSFTACTSLVHAFITSRLDYCNSLLAGISAGLMSQLQSVVRVAACLVMRKRKFDPISNDIRDHLHWLPVKQRIDFKLGLLVYKCLHGEAPAYLAEMLEHKSDNPALRRLRNTANRGPGKTRRPSLKAEDTWTTKLRHDWAIPMEQLAK